MAAKIESSFGRSWKIDKYARFIPSNDSGKGEWKYFTSYGGGSEMKISLVSPLKLVITSGSSIVLESVPLYGLDEAPCLKAIVRGDSMLFFMKVKESARRFRIQFAKDAKLAEKDNCQDFVKALSCYINVKEIESPNVDTSSQQASQSLLNNESQNQLNLSFEYDYAPPTKVQKDENQANAPIQEAKIFSTKSIHQIAQAVIKNSYGCFPDCYKSNSKLSDVEVDSIVQSCLLDPDFPALVGQVEQSMKKLLSE